MNRFIKTDAMKRLTKKVKNKRGATLVELIATVAILSIVASLSFEAIFMASEEYRRVSTMSECERSISLMQENLNLYAKNAENIIFVDNSSNAAATLTNTIEVYPAYRATSGDPLQDAENQAGDDYIDLVLYRSGEFTYTIAKYTAVTGQPVKWEEIVTIGNIKEINLHLKKLKSSFDSGTQASYLLDYAIMSPTGFEMSYSRNGNLTAGDLITEENADDKIDDYSSNEGLYSVMTGTVINNMDSWGGLNEIRISEDLPATSASSAYKGDCNFVVIRTVPREAK